MLLRNEDSFLTGKLSEKAKVMCYCGAWWLIGRFDVFRHSQLPVALRRETPIQYPCGSGSAPLSSSGLEEAL